MTKGLFFIPETKEEINKRLQAILNQGTNIGQVSNLELIYAIKLTEALLEND